MLDRSFYILVRRYLAKLYYSSEAPKIVNLSHKLGPLLEYVCLLEKAHRSPARTWFKKADNISNQQRFHTSWEVVVVVVVNVSEGFLEGP